MSILKSIARILLCLSLLIGMCHAFSSSIRREPVQPLAPPQNIHTETRSEDHFYEAIAYGNLKLHSYLPGTVIHPDPVVMEAPRDASLLCRVGERTEKTPLYSAEGKTVSLPDPVYVMSAERTDSSLIIEYYVLGHDRICFTGSASDYYAIQAGDSFKLRFMSGSVQIVEKELKDGVGFFYTPIGDYFDYYLSGCLIQRQIDDCRNVYYILNDYLTEPVDTDTYRLHIMNKYQENSEPEDWFYDKIITVRPFDDTYSIITSNNVEVWEKVYYYRESKG